MSATAAVRMQPSNRNDLVAKLYYPKTVDALTPALASMVSKQHVVSATTAYGAVSTDTLTNGVVQTLQNAPVTDTALPDTTFGLNGQSDIVYWTLEDVDQGALMLAQWPENMLIAPWPGERAVEVRVWVNPDGSVATLQFPQQDLPASVKAALSDAIRQHGFTPATKDGLPVGNYRTLELLLVQTTVPTFVIH